MERTWDQREPQTAQEVGRKEGVGKLLKLLWGHGTRQKAALEKFLAPLFCSANTVQPGKSLSQAQMRASSVEDVAKAGRSAVEAHLWAAVGSRAPFMWPGTHLGRQCCRPIPIHPVGLYDKPELDLAR